MQKEISFMVVDGAIDSIRVDGCQGSPYARSREGVLAYEPGHPYIAVSPAPLHYGGNLLLHCIK